MKKTEYPTNNLGPISWTLNKAENIGKMSVNAYFIRTKIGFKYKSNMWKFQLILSLTSSHRRPYKHAFFCWNNDRRASKHAFRFLCVLAGSLVNTSHVVVTLCGMKWVHGSVAPDKRHCQRWMSSLFCGFLPHPFIQDPFLWRASQEFVKTDLYPWSLISLRYAVCSTGCWSIIGRCIGACQRPNCAEERQP